MVSLLLAHAHTGLLPRTFGIAPEKALKMQAWVLVGRWVDRHVEKPTITKWMLAGASAGAATTLIGESHTTGAPLLFPCVFALRYHTIPWIDRISSAFPSLIHTPPCLGSSLCLAREEHNKSKCSLTSYYLPQHPPLFCDGQGLWAVAF